MKCGEKKDRSGEFFIVRVREERQMVDACDSERLKGEVGCTSPHPCNSKCVCVCHACSDACQCVGKKVGLGRGEADLAACSSCAHPSSTTIRRAPPPTKDKSFRVLVCTRRLASVVQ